MSATSKIEWTDATWNPVLGCTKVSDGCRNCYAILQAWIKQSNRHLAVREAYAGLVEQRPDGSLNWTGAVRAIPERLTIPLQWARPRRVFVNSLSDLFHESVPDEFIDQVFAVMAWCQRHTFQVLTKRPDRMAAYFAERFQHHTIDGPKIGWHGREERVFEAMQDAGYADPDRAEDWTPEGNYKWPGWPLPNVWLGTSVEDQRAADQRIPHLLRTPAAVRFLSCEPLLGPVELSDVTGRSDAVSQLGKPAMDGIGWVITGGESGPHYREADPDWYRSLRDQCLMAGVPFFFKQWSGRKPKALGRLLDGHEHNEMPAVAVGP